MLIVIVINVYMLFFVCMCFNWQRIIKFSSHREKKYRHYVATTTNDNNNKNTISNILINSQ